MKIKSVQANWLHVPIPEAREALGPGLGVEINTAFVERYAVPA